MATKKYYRSKYGQFFGVCKGFAYWRDLPLDKVRLLVIILTIATAVAPCLIIYCVLGCLLPTSDDEEQTGEDEPMRIRGTGFNYASADGFETVDDEALRRKYEELKKKVEDMESEILDRENDWDARFNKES